MFSLSIKDILSIGHSMDVVGDAIDYCPNGEFKRGQYKLLLFRFDEPLHGFKYYLTLDKERSIAVTGNTLSQLVDKANRVQCYVSHLIGDDELPPVTLDGTPIKINDEQFLSFTLANGYVVKADTELNLWDELQTTYFAIRFNTTRQLFERVLLSGPNDYVYWDNADTMDVTAMTTYGRVLRSALALIKQATKPMDPNKV